MTKPAMLSQYDEGFTLRYIRLVVDRYLVPSVTRLRTSEAAELLHVGKVMANGDPSFVCATLTDRDGNETRYILQGGSWRNEKPAIWDEINGGTIHASQIQARLLEVAAQAATAD